MRAQLLVVVIAAALLQACALTDSRAYTISRSTPKDAAKVRQILRDVANKAELRNGMNQGNVLESVTETWTSYHGINVWLQAYTSGDHIDVYLERGDWPPPRAFTRADRLLAPALSAAFGKRFHAHKDERIVVLALNGPNQTLQPTADRRDNFHMTTQHFTTQHSSLLSAVAELIFVRPLEREALWRPKSSWHRAQALSSCWALFI